LWTPCFIVRERKGEAVNETALFYFFSTVAQSFATAIALLGALVLYRLQATTAFAYDASKWLIAHYAVDGDSRARLLAMLGEGDFTGIVAFYHGPGARTQADPQYYSQRSALQSAVAVSASIQKAFKKALTLTGGLLVVSIVAIPVVPKMAELPVGVRAAMVLGVLVLGGWCLTSYWRLSETALERGLA